MNMKRTALFFASTAILFSSPSAMAEQAPINRPFISSNTNVPSQMLAQAEEAAPQADHAVEELKKHKAGQQAEEVKKRAADGADAAAKAQHQAEEHAKQQADRAAKAAEKESEQQAEQAKRAANAESDKAAKQQKAIEEEARQKAAGEAKAAKAAEKETAQEAEKAKRATEAEANNAAKQQKAIEEEARKKAAAESEAAKATQKETAKETEKAKKATEQEANKAAEAQKAAEEDARKKTDNAQKAADKQTDKAAEQAKKATDNAAKETPVAPAPEAPATAEKPTQETPATTPEQATGGKSAVPTKEAKPIQPATGEPAQQQASPLPENAAPVLDSAKPAPAGEGKDRGKGNGGKSGQTAETPADQKPVAQQPAVAPVAPPKTDADVQQELTPVKIEPVLTEKGTRTKERRPDERPSDVQVIKKFGDRTVVNVDNNIYVESSDRPRMSRGSKEVYYEDLPRSRTRETIVRDNGVQIVTIRNRYGDVIQRSRVMPDGREVVLTYTPDYDREERLQWRDPGDDLPPLELTIPVHDYIMDAEQAPEEDVYAFFEQPPVERVERIYSIDEVKRSARIRDKIRRVDLDTITFPFGSADIGEDQISHIESVAKAMAQILKKNPAETFLIEGHTDAVGSDQANLVLSDKRAESVAQALTNVFDIPPENMATQGYGERYMKIKADGPEQQNRRVAIRRITPLVAPLASN